VQGLRGNRDRTLDACNRNRHSVHDPKKGLKSGLQEEGIEHATKTHVGHERVKARGAPQGKVGS